MAPYAVNHRHRGTWAQGSEARTASTGQKILIPQNPLSGRSASMGPAPASPGLWLLSWKCGLAQASSEAAGHFDVRSPWGLAQED